MDNKFAGNCTVVLDTNSNVLKTNGYPYLEVAQMKRWHC